MGPVNYEVMVKAQADSDMDFNFCHNCRWATCWSNNGEYASCVEAPDHKNVHKNHFCGRHRHT